MFNRFPSSYDYCSLTVQQPSQSGGILSKLALHFPLVFGFWGKHSQQQIVSVKEDAVSSHETMRSYNIDKGENRIAPSIIDDRFDKHCAELQPDTINNSSKLSASRFPLYLTYIILHAGSLSFLFPFLNKFYPVLHDRDSEKNEDLFDTLANDPVPYEPVNEEGNFERWILIFLYWCT